MTAPAVVRRVDHVVVAAATLAEGAAWCEATLGVAPGPGGAHPLFGTHNRLLKIATAAHPQAYLEIIAIDPAAPAPARPRWFGLDDAALRSALRSGPRLLHVVVATSDLDADRSALAALGWDAGEPLRASRDTAAGRLEWELLVRADGRLLAGGALPTLIQWRGPHPTAAMPASGIALRSLTLRALPAPVRDLLALDGVQMVDGPGPAVEACFDTPLGAVTLRTPDPA